ncbi:MAG: DUF4491 family protein [Prevotellaceae bacterium]|jgi:hypothetical protein|nr:DUF4491 family protein [Prevotellaceae bacterium]
MYYTGLIIGFAVFLLIGMFHPLVVKAEYYLGQKAKWIFGIVSLVSLIISIFVGLELSIFLGCLGFSCLWSVFEINKQRKRRTERTQI